VRVEDKERPDIKESHLVIAVTHQNGELILKGCRDSLAGSEEEEVGGDQEFL
jgi:hypothetical protein